jgi:hypothetical protein
MTDIEKCGSYQKDLKKMNVEIELAKRMLLRSIPIYVGVPVAFYFKSLESFVTSMGSSIIVAVGFFLGAFLMSFAAKISLNFYYFAALFGYVFRLIFIFGFLLLLKRVYSTDDLAMSLTVPIVFLTMLFIEMTMVIKRKDTDLDWANDNSS